ncbi:CheY-like chemotaxis protein [Endobacter medicaginis]|uniref:CheY-like chemotaxis protein n=1 Tax=Endobacter medicaginis TaxID=1181271 RepID=A0A839UVZ3_9PROT|nr:response regulator [Endobacter medicaginis]MBB3174478.1 CheY-like chemotaxis protein [Endobacter medicaginis]MCX5475073.1 response regulator [Endobacter medicaginis]NVN29605.1 response regulator [Endobacter medicaginis]
MRQFGAIVLVVEDEPVQRMGLIAIVEEAGYQAVEAADADQAVAILERRTDIRIVLADIDMPGSMDGLRLAALVRDRWPPIEIIVTSGGRVPALERIPARAVFLPKPLNERRVRDQLARFAS